MKNFVITLSIVLFSALSIKSQTETFSPGWYIVKTGAQVKVIQGNSMDVIRETDWHQISYGHNEVLLVFNFSKDKYYCYDAEGRIVLVKGKTDLQKIEVVGRPGFITEDVQLNLDASLHPGNHVWITGFNASIKTASILLADGQKAEIPQNSIEDLKVHFDLMDKYTEWKTVE